MAGSRAVVVCMWALFGFFCYERFCVEAMVPGGGAVAVAEKFAPLEPDVGVWLRFLKDGPTLFQDYYICVNKPSCT